jgi:hypothetical protein
VESTLVFVTWLFFAEGRRNEGLDRWQFRTRGLSRPRAGRTGDEIGCTGGAEEGNSRNHAKTWGGASPSLGLPAHAARAIGRRRRKASSRWMVGLIIGYAKPFTGGKRIRGDFTRARGSRPVGLIPREG